MKLQENYLRFGSFLYPIDLTFYAYYYCTSVCGLYYYVPYLCFVTVFNCIMVLSFFFVLFFFGPSICMAFEFVLLLYFKKRKIIK